MKRSRPTAYRAFLALADAAPETTRFPVSHPATITAPAPYQSCTCGKCRQCFDNARWDRIFAKFEVKESDVRGVYRSALADL